MDLGQHQLFILHILPYSIRVAFFFSPIHSCHYRIMKVIPEDVFKILVIKF